MANNQIATAKNSEVTAAQIPNSQRFANKILKEFSDSAGNIQIGEKHRRLIQSYFIGISRALTTAEANRVRKNANNKDHKYDEPLAYTWNNVDLNASFAQALVQYAKLGVDMTLPNQLAPVLFKDNKIRKTYLAVITRTWNICIFTCCAVLFLWFAAILWPAF